MKRAATAAGAFAVLLVGSRPAHAELHELASRVADSYRAAGARVFALPPRFLYEDETLVLALPPANDARCLTAAIVGARGLSFHVGELEDTHAHETTVRGVDDEGHVYSVAGALELHTCDAKPSSIRVRSDAGRGALEVVVAYSHVPLPPLPIVLPERVGGALPPNVDPGPVPALPPPDKRADAAEAVARRDGATVAARAMAVATDNGSGVVHVRLDRACHRIELFSPEAHAGRRKARLDLDAELHDESGDVLYARDRSEAADARLDVCLADHQETLLSFGGALPGAPVIITRSSWALPSTIPTVWGADAVRRFAGALRGRHVIPVRPPIGLYEGVVGSTAFVVPVERGGCYVAVAAATRGTPRGLVLRALVGATEHGDERGTTDGGALTSFCASDHDHVRLTVEARGSSLAWGAAVYHMTSADWQLGP